VLNKDLSQVSEKEIVSRIESSSVINKDSYSTIDVVKKGKDLFVNQPLNSKTI
jgi:hypothetical protein